MTVTDDMATADTTAPLEIGRARLRKEDRRLVTGRNRYTDSMVLPGMHYLAMVRSPFARARITAIDTSAAVAADGVVAVLTGADVAGVQGSLPNAWPITTDQSWTAAGSGESLLMRSARRKPSTIPTMPPNVESVTDSVRIW